MLYAEDKIRVLIRAAFPDRRDLEKPDAGDDPDQLARIQAFRTFKSQFDAMSSEELDRRYMEHLRVQQERAEQAAKRNDEMAYFSRPEAKANFPVWCALEEWTIDEATALLLGKDPLKVGWSNVSKIEEDSIFKGAYGDLRQRLLRAKEDGRFSDPDKWEKLVKWARETGMDLPPSLNATPAAPRTENGDDLKGKRRTSALTLVLGMAMAKYAYDPKALKNQATSKIVGDLRLNGLLISDDTVRDFLDEAVAEILDQNPK
ncbi:hypothetical protein IVB25_20945 [Bradyrhizobium sp. 193]|uniref:hypothetical protein n=1 Tax=unclassified Bradyrhizobium TaxID=2631580 RepID=UPI001FF8F4D2|nr:MULTISPECIES: hypothetical protein [unclassified Bradyrhizobium]MCK1485086.1 hypothetical protein [Bradyrhizobium sp. 193]MCK1586294.1 hypothetical protein [Bradyrhizobium sp. 169]